MKKKETLLLIRLNQRIELLESEIIVDRLILERSKNKKTITYYKLKVVKTLNTIVELKMLRDDLPF